MSLTKYINVPAFLISLAFGLFAVYLFSPKDRTIIVYPNHENADLLQYKDKANNCFSIKEEEVVCPGEDEIAKIPPQS